MKNKIKLSSEGKGICCLKCSGYFEHRIGSHSDDRGGDSDYPCYCNQNDCKNPDCECHNQKSLDKKKTKELDWEIEFDKKFHTTWIKSHDSMIGLNPVYAGVKCYLVDSFKVKSFISSLLLKQKQQILNLECLKEEKVTIVGHKYGTDTGEIEKMIGEGEEEWKVPRNQLRNEIKSEIEKL